MLRGGTCKARPSENIFIVEVHDDIGPVLAKLLYHCGARVSYIGQPDGDCLALGAAAKRLRPL